jgi:thioredoxin 2
MSFSAIHVCGNCGKSNRVPARHLADTGKCGNCKSTLPPHSEPLEVDEAGFDEITREAPVPVLTDFWASWCGPCLAAAPEVNTLAKELAGRALVLKVNTEENPNLMARYRIQSIPNFMAMRRGQVVLQRAGFGGLAEMRRWLEPVLRQT